MFCVVLAVGPVECNCKTVAVRKSEVGCCHTMFAGPITCDEKVGFYW